MSDDLCEAAAVRVLPSSRLLVSATYRVEVAQEKSQESCCPTAPCDVGGDLSHGIQKEFEPRTDAKNARKAGRRALQCRRGKELRRRISPARPTSDPKSQSRRTTTLADSSQSVRQSTTALRRAKGVV